MKQFGIKALSHFFNLCACIKEGILLLVTDLKKLLNELIAHLELPIQTYLFKSIFCKIDFNQTSQKDLGGPSKVNFRSQITVYLFCNQGKIIYTLFGCWEGGPAQNVALILPLNLTPN